MQSLIFESTAFLRPKQHAPCNTPPKGTYKNLEPFVTTELALSCIHASVRHTLHDRGVDPLVMSNVLKLTDAFAGACAIGGDCE